MNFQSMEYFLALDKERSFTKAAERLHITQQTLSAHIAALERELGTQLFVRHVPLELTHGGEVFARYAVEFQQKQLALQREFSDIAENKAGVLRVGIAPTRGRVLMPALIESFRRVYPKVTISMLEAPNDILQQKLLDGEVDLGIGNFIEKLPGISLQEFYEEEIVLLLPKQLLVKIRGKGAVGKIKAGGVDEAIAFLQECPLLLNAHQDIAGKMGRSLLAARKLTPWVAAQSENIGTLLELCVRGVGACFSPLNLAKELLSEQELEQLLIISLGEQARYMLHLGWLADNCQWSLLEKFISLCLESRKGS